MFIPYFDIHMYIGYAVMHARYCIARRICYMKRLLNYGYGIISTVSYVQTTSIPVSVLLCHSFKKRNIHIWLCLLVRKYFTLPSIILQTYAYVRVYTCFGQVQLVHLPFSISITLAVFPTCLLNHTSPHLITLISHCVHTINKKTTTTIKPPSQLFFVCIHLRPIMFMWLCGSVGLYTHLQFLCVRVAISMVHTYIHPQMYEIT